MKETSRQGVWQVPVYYVFGVLLLGLAIGYSFQMPWATGTWMWPDGRLSYLFVGSMIAAIAAGMLGVAYKQEWAGGFAGSLNWTVSFAVMGFMLFSMSDNPETPGAASYAIGFLAAAIWSLGYGLTLRHYSPRDTRRIPPLVRYSFLAFLIVLAFVATALLMTAPHVFPWPLKPQSSVMFGSLFLGSAVYFVYGFLRPCWGVAQSQLLAFLAYDLVLIVPYLQHFSTVKPEHYMSLIVYTIVIVYSMAMSVFYLFIKKESSLFRASA